MILAWKKFHFVVTCGYIVGFPNDTEASLMRDVETIKRDLAIDNIYLNYLTPLPGSEDHKKLYEAGVWMDPDMNKYTLSTCVSHHPTMSDADWDWAYREFHSRYYTFEHMETILRRMFAVGSGRKRATVNRPCRFQGGCAGRRLSPCSNPATSAYAAESSGVRACRSRACAGLLPLALVQDGGRGAFAYLSTFVRLRAIVRRIEADPNRSPIADAALTLGVRGDRN